MGAARGARDKYEVCMYVLQVFIIHCADAEYLTILANLLATWNVMAKLTCSCSLIILGASRDVHSDLVV